MRFQRRHLAVPEVRESKIWFRVGNVPLSTVAGLHRDGTMIVGGK